MVTATASFRADVDKIPQPQQSPPQGPRKAAECSTCAPQTSGMSRFLGHRLRVLLTAPTPFRPPPSFIHLATVPPAGLSGMLNDNKLENLASRPRKSKLQKGGTSGPRIMARHCQWRSNPSQGMAENRRAEIRHASVGC